MIIGIDIDDTITNHCEAWFDVYNQHYKQENVEPLKIEDAYKWDFYNDWSEDNKKRLFDAICSGDYYDKLKLLPNVREVIEKLINSENKVILISATHKEYQEGKKEWILKQLPILKEDDIIFTSNKELINVDYMIDDNLQYAEKFKCTFLLYRQPWNTNRPSYEYSNNIVNVGNWKDIEQIFTKLGIINISVINSKEDLSLSEATQKLVKGIKEAKDDKEITQILNPYIKLWQQQGMIIGMKQINDATMLVIEDVIKEMRGEDKNEKK